MEAGKEEDIAAQMEGGEDAAQPGSSHEEEDATQTGTPHGDVVAATGEQGVTPIPPEGAAAPEGEAGTEAAQTR